MRSKKKSPAHAGMRYSGTKHSENADLSESLPLLRRRFSQNHNWYKPDHTTHRLKLRLKFAKPIHHTVNVVLYEQPIREPEEQIAPAAVVCPQNRAAEIHWLETG